MGFTSEEIRQKFQQFKRIVGKCRILRVQIKYAECMSCAESDLIAEDAALRSGGPPGQPRGSGTGDPTAAAAAYLIENRNKIAREMNRELLRKQAELYECIRDIGYVEGWLTGLHAREKFIIENHLIEGMTWRDLTGLYERRFNEPCTADGLRKIQKAAIEAIIEMSK